MEINDPWLSLCYLFFLLKECFPLAKSKGKLNCYNIRTYFCLTSLFLPNYNSKLKIHLNYSILKTHLSN